MKFVALLAAALTSLVGYLLWPSHFTLGFGLFVFGPILTYNLVAYVLERSGERDAR